MLNKVKLKKKNLSSQAYEALREMVINSRFKPGSRVNIERLSKDFGISRTPVWEGVRRLEQEGLLVNIPNRGVFMVEMTPRMALELYSVREVLEGLAARSAARICDDHKVSLLEKCLEKQERIVRDGDVVAFSRLSFEFHRLIYEMADNEILLEMILTLVAKMRPVIRLTKSMIKKLAEEHVDLVEAIKKRDEDTAERIIREHNRNVGMEIQDQTKEATLILNNSQGSQFIEF